MDPFMAAMMSRLMRGGMGASNHELPRTPQEKAERRERLLRIHQHQLKALVDDMYAKDRYLIHNSVSHDVKPRADFPTPPPLHSLTPISISEMRPGTTHRGRMLRGRLLVEPLLMTGLNTLLEDENGDVLLVGVYNMLPSNLGGMAGQRAGARALPAGQAVAIVEPFFKIMADGSPGVRVDNPREVVFLDSLSPPNAAALREDGRRHFQAARYSDAVSCYRAALLRMPDASGSGTDLLVALLLNMSICHQKLNQHQLALVCAAAAAAVRPESSKAHYRAALALAQLNKPLAARCALQQAFESMPGGGPSAEEWRAMVGGLAMVPGAGEPPSAKQATKGRTEFLRLLAGGHEQLMDILPMASTVKAVEDGDAAAAAAAAVAEASAAKETGNADFKANRFAEALRQYRNALRVLLEALPAATLLTNLATCHLQQADPMRALANATTAVLLDATNAKAHHRRCEALLQLGWLEEAKTACLAGLQALSPGDAGGREALGQLQDRIRTAEQAAASANRSRAGSGKAGGSGSDSSRMRYLTERETEAMRGPTGSVELTSFMNQLKAFADLDPKVARKFEELKREDPLSWMAMQRDSRVAPFHDEFSKAGRWPAQCDVETCRRRLWDAYELCVGMATHLLGMAHLEGVDPVDFFVKRVGCLNEDGLRQMQWFAEAPDGAVSFRRERGASYNPTIFHSFPNAAGPAVPMPPGPCSAASCQGRSAATVGTAGRSDAGNGATVPGAASATRTHVAIGFVDLGTLAAAVDLGEWDGQVQSAERELQGGAGAAPSPAGSTSDSTGPSTSPLLRWVGYEASPYSVAKTLVLERMMRRGPCAADHVMQVWYSSVWTPGALDAFRAALTELLREGCAGPGARSGSGSGPLPEEVLAYLRHWQLKDVGLATSRRKWLDDWKRTFALVGQFKEKSDRLALCEYLITGQLPGLGDIQLVGSVVMFANPRDGPERALDENFLQVLDPHELLTARISRGGLDIVSAAAAVLRRRVVRLASLLATRRVDVQVILRAVKPADPATHAAIRSMRPATISWSNVPDYYGPGEWHDMARSCSAPGTVHHMMAMNWPFDVKGASHMDLMTSYLARGEAEGIRLKRKLPASGSSLPEPAKALRKRILAVLEAGQNAVRQQLTQQAKGAGKALLFIPPVDNPRNVADQGLLLKHYRVWVNEFLAAGGLPKLESTNATSSSARSGPWSAVMAEPTFGALSRTNTTLSLAFSYGST